ncbi:hypothetical protein NIES4071_104170 (plasmid) [Calothrix sp. NIES-4071]|nr:hypothetical protein NIES4071_104170 [Calothrix sp. NIES-4071]BAZ64404.1 hypothetical protein NIES4105_101370 [Calothrix sp. NIES-4105]
MIDPKYYPLVANLLKMASEEYANRSCNDYDLSEILPNIEDKHQLAKSMEEENGSPEEFDPNQDYNTVNDSWLFGYFASLFNTETVLPNSPYYRCHQELLGTYTVLSNLFQSLSKDEFSKISVEASKKLADDILTIREAIARAENHIPNISPQ